MAGDVIWSSVAIVDVNVGPVFLRGSWCQALDGIGRVCHDGTGLTHDRLESDTEPPDPERRDLGHGTRGVGSLDVIEQANEPTRGLSRKRDSIGAQETRHLMEKKKCEMKIFRPQ